MGIAAHQQQHPSWYWEKDYGDKHKEMDWKWEGSGESRIWASMDLADWILAFESLVGFNASVKVQGANFNSPLQE